MHFWVADIDLYVTFRFDTQLTNSFNNFLSLVPDKLLQLWWSESDRPFSTNLKKGTYCNCHMFYKFYVLFSVLFIYGHNNNTAYTWHKAKIKKFKSAKRSIHGSKKVRTPTSNLDTLPKIRVRPRNFLAKYDVTEVLYNL